MFGLYLRLWDVIFKMKYKRLFEMPNVAATDLEENNFLCAFLSLPSDTSTFVEATYTENWILQTSWKDQAQKLPKIKSFSYVGNAKTPQRPL